MKFAFPKSSECLICFAIATLAVFAPTAPARSLECETPELTSTDDPNGKPQEPKTESALGLWEQRYEFMGVPMVDRYELKKAAKGGYEGVLTREGKEISKLEDIRIDGDKIQFVAKGTTDGTDWKVDFTGTVQGDDIEGSVKISVNEQSFESPWKPKRIKNDK